MRVAIDDNAARTPRKAMADCRAYLARLNAEQEREPLQRDPWEMPPPGPSRGGYWFKPEFVGRAEHSDPKAVEQEAYRLACVAFAEKLASTLPEDNRKKLLGRMFMPRTAQEREWRRKLDEAVGPEPTNEWANAAWLHMMTVQAFRWDLQERIVVALDDLPARYRASAEACELHLQTQQSKCRALQPADRQQCSVRVEPTDVALNLITDHRGGERRRNRAAEEMAVAESHLGPLNWSLLADIERAIACVDQMRNAGTYPLDLEFVAPIRRRARQIAQGFKDRSGRNTGWKTRLLNDPLEALCAQPVSGPGEFSLAVQVVLNGCAGANDLGAFIRKTLEDPRARLR